MNKRKKYFWKRFIAIEISLTIGCFLLCWFFDFNKIAICYYLISLLGIVIFMGLMCLGEYYDSLDYKKCPKCNNGYFKESSSNFVECISCGFLDYKSNQLDKPLDSQLNSGKI